ncbi:MAG: IS21 family transposase [Bacteroidota bacterium]
MKQRNAQKLLIVQYRSQGESIRQIAKMLNMTKYRVGQILEESGKPAQEKIRVSELLEPMREQIIEWLEVRQMPARLIHKRLTEKKIQVSETSVRRYLSDLKKREVFVHVPTKAGEECQIDFGYLGRFLKDGKQVKVWVFCQVLSHSRYAFYKAVTDQTTDTFFNCQVEAMEFFGGVTSKWKIDNLTAAVLKCDLYQPLIQKQYAEMAGHYKATIVTCRIKRGSDKGIVESGVKYVKNNFLKNLECKELSELHTQLAYWNKTVCNLREHGTLRKTPLEIYLKEEKRKLQPLPLKRYEIFHYEPRTVNQFGHIYYRYNQYSVPSHLEGEQVLIASNGKVIKIFKNDVQVAMHLVDSYKGKDVTEEHHKPYHKRAKTTEYYRQMLEPIGQYALQFFDRILTLYPFAWKRMCNGIRHLAEKYTKSLIDKACLQALASPQTDYARVKKIAEALNEEPVVGTVQPAPVIGVRGYAHDLKKYDKFVTVFKD